MTLTIGTGPFGYQPAGTFNFTRQGPAHVLYVEDSPRRIRASVGDVTIVDTPHAKLLHETGLLPVYYLPVADVRAGVLEASGHRTHCPFKGDASHFHLVVGDRRAEDAVWTYPEPLEGAPDLSDYVAIAWDAADAWYEEDEAALVHPTDPYHRVDALASSRHVRVSLDGELLADSADPVVLFEAGLPPRFYLSRGDVRADVLEASDSTSRCPYKGEAGYHSVRVGGELVADLAWTYAEPLAGVDKIAGRVCFYDERVDVEVDDHAQLRPVTRFA